MNGFTKHRKRRPHRRRTIAELQVLCSHRIDDDDPFASANLETAVLRSFVGGGRARAEILIPPYEPMMVGDRVTVAWEKRLIALPPVTEEQLGMPLGVTIKQAMRDLSATRDVRITWQVLHPDGSWSRWAPASYAPLRCSGSYAPTPWLECTDGDLGRVFEVSRLSRNDPIVRVEGHVASMGDRVILRCDTIMATGRTESWESNQVRVGRDGQTLDFHLPYDLFRRAIGGCCVLHYTISAPRIAPRDSVRRRVDVTGAPVRFIAPVIQQLDGAVLDPQHAAGGASVDVPLWPGAAADDECVLIWEGTGPDGTVATYTETATGREAIERECLTFPVPADEVRRLDGGSLRVAYRVTVRADVENEKNVQREVLHTLESEWLSLRVQTTKSPSMVVTDDLNGLTYRRIDTLRRAYLTFTPTLGQWAIRGGRDGIPPFHDGTFLSCADEKAALRIVFSQSCTSVRFGYGANGPGGNGSIVCVDIYGRHGDMIGEAVYTVPVTGLPGLWIQLHAKDYGERIGSIVVRKDTEGMFRKVTAQIDNFTLGW
ncbi:hypothetical protein L2Y96_09970 [Luteibacter aegosomaticola]|uniref:hypothetical protein n=1 Tax=Luteibacter aegosomaticola TaxID=2911538 RepID=UPI001FF8991A|nr:hypothetical protein [Luteibacter aegosomaticola]UPG92067.1 hypothetical protein L2Y96_09970 [Luteibacter aegosomaticola]